MSDTVIDAFRALVAFYDPYPDYDALPLSAVLPTGDGPTLEDLRHLLSRLDGPGDRRVHPRPLDIPNGMYRHYRSSNLYEVYGLSQQESTGRWEVLYRNAHSGEPYHRPADEWYDDVNGTPRFSLAEWGVDLNGVSPERGTDENNSRRSLTLPFDAAK